MANYKLTQLAKSDLKRIYTRGLVEFGEIKADQYYYALFERFEQIAKTPLIYQDVSYIRQGYRRCPYGQDNIYYRINDSTVEIIRILGRQDGKALLEA